MTLGTYPVKGKREKDLMFDMRQISSCTTSKRKWFVGYHDTLAEADKTIEDKCTNNMIPSSKIYLTALSVKTNHTLNLFYIK